MGILKKAVPTILALAGALGAATATRAATSSVTGSTRTITLSARQYAFDPPRIRVDQGDLVRIRAYSKDVVHGFYLEGHDIDATIVPQENLIKVAHPTSGRPTEYVKEIEFRADRRGKFRYRCSQTCGSLHPFMTGELIVGPNSPLHAGLGGLVGLGVGLLLFLAARSRMSSRGHGPERVAQ